MMRDQILAEIVRIAEANGGKPPGRKLFESETGIPEHRWSGRFWSKWSAALAEAGYKPNTLTQPLEPAAVLDSIIAACRHFGHVPTVAELKLYKRIDASLPSTSAITRRFGSQGGMVAAIRERCAGLTELADVTQMLPSDTTLETTTSKASQTSPQGSVYLLKSGDHFKVGRSDDLERRIKEIRVALPQAAVLVHAIRTDDPAGIEAYWHRRFADRRANGEWFKLTTQDVAAFRRRTFQ